MNVKTPESFARIKALTYLFVDASKRGYLDHLAAQSAIERIGEVEYHPELIDSITQRSSTKLVSRSPFSNTGSTGKGRALIDPKTA